MANPLLIALVIGGVLWVATRRKKSKVPPVTEEEAVDELVKEGISAPQPPKEGAAFVSWPGARRASEMFNAVVAEETRPSERHGRSGDPDSPGWLTNVAFWATYPEALDFPEGKIPSNFKEVPDWQSYANAWVRIYKGIKNIIASKGGKKKGKPSNLWDFKDVATIARGDRLGDQPLIMIVESKVPSRSSYASVAQHARNNSGLLFAFVSAKDMKRAAEWLGYNAPPAGYYVGATYGDIDYGFGHSPGSDFSDFVEGVAQAYNESMSSIGDDFDEAINQAVQNVRPKS